MRRAAAAPLSQNTALFSLLGTTYGGDGKSNFALPDLQGRAPMHPGQGPGLSLHDLGETEGSETVTLLESEIPAHAHPQRTSTEDADNDNPSATNVTAGSVGISMCQNPPVVAGSMAPEALSPAGGDQPHNNLMPYLTFYFCIALQGVFPPGGHSARAGGVVLDKLTKESFACSRAMHSRSHRTMARRCR